MNIHFSKKMFINEFDIYYLFDTGYYYDIKFSNI